MLLYLNLLSTGNSNIALFEGIAVKHFQAILCTEKVQTSEQELHEENR